MTEPAQLRVIACGDRNWGFYDQGKDRPSRKDRAEDEARWLFEYLDRLHERHGDSLYIIDGGARGADTLARMWRENRGVPGQTYKADWAKYHKGAGPIRNTQMLVEGEANLVVAFHTFIGNSKGTKNMVRQAREAGLKTLIVGKDGKEYPWVDNGG